MSDIQSLLLYCLVGDRAPYQPHRWATLLKWNRLSNVVVLVLEGVGLDDYQAHFSEIGWIRKQKVELVEVMSTI